MIEISNSYESLISFDGRVIEVFERQESKRFHIKQIKSIEYKEKRNGDFEISGKTTSTFFMLQNIDSEQKAQVDDFINQVNSLME